MDSSPRWGGINRGGSPRGCPGDARAVANRVGGDPGRTGPLTLPPSRQPARLALRGAGSPIPAAPARTSLEAALERLCAAGVALRTLEDCPQLAAVEAAMAEAHQITMGISA
jgi:hypothetical protein